MQGNLVFREDAQMWWLDDQRSTELVPYLFQRIPDIDHICSFVPEKVVAVQAGGCVGLWPLRLNKHFERVYTFEPCEDLFECLSRNVRHAPGVIAENCVLGPIEGEVNFSRLEGGWSCVAVHGETRVRQRTIDSLNLIRCDLIYLDVERYELQALEGAVHTIKKFSPVIAVETKRDTLSEYLAWFAYYGYLQKGKFHDDMVFVKRHK